MNRTDWIQTYTGLRFYPFEPDPENVCIEDIAHALSLICRFGGHCKQFYSVAQHSVLVSLNCPHPLHGLLHDAEEAYIGDVCRPVKRSMIALGSSILTNAAVGISEAIYKKLGVVWTDQQVHDVKGVDNMMLSTEARILMAGMADGTTWTSTDLFPPFDFVVAPVGPREAERMFLDRYEELRRI